MLKRLLFLNLASILLIGSTAQAASIKYKVFGKVVACSGCSVVFLKKSGATKTVGLPSSGKFAFSKLTTTELKGASLQLVDDDGRYAGPVVLAKKGTKVSISFSGSKKAPTAMNLGAVTFNTSYGKVRSNLNKNIYAKALVPADTNGKPAGAGELGLVLAPATAILRARAAADSSQGADQDLDGIPDTFDADDDGDLILDASDPDSAGQDVPYTSLNFDFRKTLNAHVRTGLSDELIDAAIGGTNVFSLTFFYSLPSDTTVDGGHVICDDALTYCRKNTPLAFYGGISESTTEFRDHPWSELLSSDGFPRMERITVGGSFPAIVASIQPRVGRDLFRPGDVYRVVLTSGTTEVSSRSLALTPYFVSVPAIKEYDAGFGAVAVDYNSVDANSGSIPGTSPGDPIVLSGTGDLNLTFWRPQRTALRSDESGYYDWGNLHYGIVIESTQSTCGGLYSAASSELTADDTPLGEGDSPLASSGANMYPYTDSRGDRSADSSNTLTLTVNLKNCLSRAGSSAGVYRVNLGAVGESLTGGQNAAAQGFYVQIP